MSLLLGSKYTEIHFNCRTPTALRNRSSKELGENISCLGLIQQQGAEP